MGCVIDVAKSTPLVTCVPAIHKWLQQHSCQLWSNLMAVMGVA
jgi:hypothetical protein